MTTAPTLQSVTAPVGSGNAGTVWTRDDSETENTTDVHAISFVHPSDTTKGFFLVYYKTGPKAGKQFVNVNYDDNTNVPDSIENVTQGTGGQTTSTSEVEYTTGDTLRYWQSNYQYALINDVVTDATWNFTSGSGGGGGTGGGAGSAKKVFCNFW